MKGNDSTARAIFEHGEERLIQGLHANQFSRIFLAIH